MGFLYIVLSVAGFSLIAVGAKFADAGRCRPVPLCALMYAWAMLAAGLFALRAGQAFAAPAAIYWIALPFGLSSVIGILALQTGIRYGNISTSWLIINLSAALPAAGSLILYHEPVSPRKLLVLLLVLVSVILLWLDKNREQAKETPKP